MKRTINKVLVALLIFSICIFGMFLTGSSVPQKAYADESSRAVIVEREEIGYAINVVTAQYLDDVETAYMVLDSSKIGDMTISKFTRNTTPAAVAYSSSNIKDIAVAYSAAVGIGVEKQNLIGLISGNFESAASFDYSNYAYKFLYVYDQETIRYKLTLDDYANPATYEDLFSTYYLNDLKNLSEGTLSYSAFFDKYGTHLIGSALYGGRISAFYSIVSNEIVVNPEIAAAAAAQIGVNVSSDSVVKLKTAAGTAAGVDYSQSNYATAFGVSAHGGDVFTGTTVNNFTSAISTWLSSLNDDSKAVVMDYEDGLVPLWEILPEEYSSLSQAMESAYNSYYNSSERNILNEFKNGDYVHFSGGCGTANDPFLIENATQLRNIENIRMKMHYRLINNIDLSGTANWNAIGGHYKGNAFNGTLDGSGLKITGLKRTSDITEVNNRIYFGLFGYIGTSGVVKNIDFYNVNIAMTGPLVNNANTRVFVGVVAGSVHGTVSGVDVVSGSCSYDANTNGNAYVGGIAGVVYQGTITACTNNIPITAVRYAGVAGGIAGYSTGGTFKNCYNYKDITAKGTGWGGAASAGGIIGEKCSNSDYVTTITNCVNSGTLKAEKYDGLTCTLKKGNMFAKENESVYN